MPLRRMLRRSASVTLLALIVMLTAMPLLASAASGPSPIPSIFDPYSTPAHDIYHLSLFVVSICAGIFLVVFTLIVTRHQVQKAALR